MRECANASSRIFSKAVPTVIMPSLDAAHISYNLLKVLGDGLPVGPVLVGAAQPAHVMTASVTARGLVNMTALAVIEPSRRSKGIGMAEARPNDTEEIEPGDAFTGSMTNWSGVLDA